MRRTTIGHLLSGPARMHLALRAFDHPGLNVTVFDPETVIEANAARQLISPADVGTPRPSCVTRLNLFYGLTWSAVPGRWPEDGATGPDSADLVIAAVDDRPARAAIDQACRQRRVPARYRQPDDHRAALLGTPVYRAQPLAENDEPRLPTAVELYPQITAPAADDGPPLSLAEALGRQTSSSTPTSPRRRSVCGGRRFGSAL